MIHPNQNNVQIVNDAGAETKDDYIQTKPL